MHTQHKSFSPSSYRVTVRRISSSHLNETSDDLNSMNRMIPSIPFKKIVAINDGTQMSSTSFMTKSDDQVMTE